LEHSSEYYAEQEDAERQWHLSIGDDDYPYW
jgi:hypothetical protein